MNKDTTLEDAYRKRFHDKQMKYIRPQLAAPSLEALNSLQLLMKLCFLNAQAKGFWDQALVREFNEEGTLTSEQFLPQLRNKGEMVALMHSELSEMLEAVRKPTAPSEHIPSFTAEEEELGDLLIRAFDYAAAYGLRLPEVIFAKMQFNSGRPYKHGKKF